VKFERIVPRSILVPVDDSLGVTPTLRVVERLAAAARARVTLLHVVPFVSAAASHDTTSLNLASMQARVSRHDAESSLWALADELRGHGLETAPLIDTGEPAHMILSQADALKADLLVMATRSPPLAERLMLGSVAEQVVQRAQVPVLFVPPGARRWRASQPVDVLIPLDGSPLAERALPIGSGLAQLLHGDLHLLRVASLAEAPTANAYLEDVRAALELEGVTNVRGSVLSGGSAATVIHRYAQERSVGLIALASHGRSGISRAVLGSVATDVLRAASLPVVVVPPGARTPDWPQASAKGSFLPDAHAS
jgi:nucleotide-binding universal stress UspA family protein